jgi:predicted PurR-regulated permease PerM
VTNLLIVLLIGFYLALNPKLYVDSVVTLFPRQARSRAREILSALGRALRWWLIGRIAAMATVGVLTALGLWIVGMPLVLALGLIAGVFSFVPFIGPVASAVPAILIALVQSPWEVAYVICVYAVVQLLEGNFITPVIQKRVVLLPPAALLAAQLLMGVLFGLVGLVFATPLAVVLIVLVQMLYVEDVLGDRVHVLGEHGGLSARGNPGG